MKAETKEKFNIWYNKVKEATKAELKNPWFYIGFGIMYALLNSPWVICGIVYFLSKDEKLLAIGTAYFSMVCVTTFPVPVLPLSFFSGLTCCRISRKIKERRKQKQNEDANI